jgi:hypothetical protein
MFTEFFAKIWIAGFCCMAAGKKYHAKHNVMASEHPPYSPDLSPADFSVYTTKSLVKGKQLSSAEELLQTR